MATLDISIHDIAVEHDGIIFIQRDGGKLKIELTEQEKDLLRERLEEYYAGGE